MRLTKVETAAKLEFVIDLLKNTSLSPEMINARVAAQFSSGKMRANKLYALQREFRGTSYKTRRQPHVDLGPVVEDMDASVTDNEVPEDQREVA